jgi:hypothetical protein
LAKNKDAAVAKEGFAFLATPKGVTGCSVDGKEYQADENGVVEVPSEHVAELVDRGFKSAEYVTASDSLQWPT